MKVITVGMHEAKTTLSQLVQEAAKGSQVVISNHGEPVAKLVPYPREQREPGLLAGQVTIKPGFDEIPEGFDDFTG